MLSRTPRQAINPGRRIFDYSKINSGRSAPADLDLSVLSASQKLSIGGRRRGNQPGTHYSPVEAFLEMLLLDKETLRPQQNSLPESSGDQVIALT